MASPPGYDWIDRLLEAGDFEGAREALKSVPADDDAFVVLRVKLGLYEGSLPPGAAQQRLIQLMRRDAGVHGAKELYQEASNLSFRERQSSSSHSHPPPPPNDDDHEKQ
ncbi:MAG: hypothetical protein OZ921_12265 [Sorangiineae bacterium]|nr:hypothetical protein [Polyangiaceae bacterium]MEB2323280.1 hypothetical protein [Sorangiineae bacterium]